MPVKSSPMGIKVSERSTRQRSEVSPDRVRRLPDARLPRIDRQRPIPEVQRAAVVLLLSVIDAEAVQHQRRRRLEAEGAFELGAAFGVAVGWRQGGAEVGGDEVGL